jgi:hypothetical protein
LQTFRSLVSSLSEPLLRQNPYLGQHQTIKMDYDAMMLDTEAAGPVVKIPVVSTREAKSFMKARLTRNMTDCAALGRLRAIKR